MHDTSENLEPRRAKGIDWPIVAFFAVAFALAWGIFFVFRIAAQRAGVDDTAAFMGHIEALDFNAIPGDPIAPPWLLYALSRVADFSFSIAGVALIAFTAGTRGLRELGRRLTRFRMPGIVWFAAALPFLLYLVATLIAASGDPSVGDGLDVSGKAIAAALFGAETGILFHLFFRGAFGEELGLRGFALPRLQERFGPVRASLVIGVLWYAWHLPVLVGRGAGQMMVFAVAVMLLAFVFTWLFNSSGGSLIPVLLFHAFQNSEDAFERILPPLKGTSWEGPATIGLLLFGVVVTIVVVRNRRKGDTSYAISPIQSM